MKATYMKNMKRGFTLIELIVVIVILAILASIAVPNLSKYINTASSRAIQATAHNIQVVLQAEKVDRIDEVFADGDGNTKCIAGDDRTYRQLLLESGVSIYDDSGDSGLTNITWKGSVLNSFKYYDGQFYISYNILGGFRDVTERDPGDPADI